MKINIIYLIILQVFDFILIDIFQVGFINNNLCFVPLLSFIGFQLIISDTTLEKSIIYSIIFGLIQDFIMYNSLFESVFIYIIIAIICHYWSKYLNDNFFSNMVLLMVLIFIREVLVYTYRYYGSLTSISFSYFVVNRLFIIMFFNAFLVALVILLNSFRIRLIIKDEYNKRLSEDLFGFKVNKGGN